MEQNGYLNYQSMLASITTGTSQLEGVCQRLSMEAQADELGKIEGRLKNHVFSVGIMGEFRRGKSTVINALLGQEIVPSDIVPTSATLNYVRWDVDKRAEIHFKDGTSKEVPVEELSKYVTKITKEAEETAANVEDAVVFYPCQFCQNGVQIVDTPGLNDDERMTAIAENVIPTLDAIVMVVVPDSPFSQSEAEFVRTKVMSSDLGRILFVINKIDTVDEEDRQRLLDSIKEKIQNSVLEKMKAVYGEDSEEYKNAKAKVGEIRLLPVSARQALRGKVRKDAAKLEESGYPEFEELLSVLLTEERGVLELIHPMNQMLSVSKEIAENLKMRCNALRMDAEEFERIQMESIAKIKETREKKKEEISRWRLQGQATSADLLPDVIAAYDEVESALTEYVDRYEITEANLASKDAIQNLVDAVTANFNSQVEEILAIHAERMMAKVQDQLGSDVEKLKNFGEEFNANLSSIHMDIASHAEIGGGSNSTLKNVLLDVGGICAGIAMFGAFIPGVGGLIAGFREHGAKGAVVGGVAGGAIGAAAIGAGLALGIGALPLALIGGAAAAFGGKKIVELVFGKKQRVTADSIRSSMYDSVQNTMAELKKERLLETWLETTCKQAYNEVAANIDSEWENSLRTMEETLTQLQVDLKMKAADKEKAEADLAEYAAIIESVCTSIKPIREKLAKSLGISEPEGATVA